MWFLSAPNARPTPCASAKRKAFRPRLEALEDRCLLSAGALDITFGSGGLVTGPSAQATNPRTALPASPVSAVVVQPDGKIITGGYLNTATKSGSISDFALARYNANGSLDTTFGKKGVVQTLVGVGNSYINGIALQTNGDIVAVGQAVIKTKGSYDPVFAVARYLPTGALDTTFGSGGMALTIVESGQFSSGTVGAFAVAIAGSGPYANDIYVAGTASPNLSSDVGAGDQFALARYLPTGALDTAFGSGGMVVTPQFVANQPAQAFALTIQSDNKIVLAGTTGDPVGTSGTPWAMAVARYTPTGGLDPNFNGTGVNYSGIPGVVTGLAPSGYYTRAHGVLVQSNTGGAIVIAGNSYQQNSTNEYQSLARLNSSGGIDTSFGGGTGYAINMNLYGAYALAQAANGDLLAASATPLNVSPPANKYGVAAFLLNGAPDTTFGTGGTSYADFSSRGFSSGGSYDTALALQPDGKIVVAGFIQPPGSTTFTSALARFLPPATFSATPSTVTAGSSVTLAATSNMMSPTSTITQVAFYRDSNPVDGTLEPGTDSLLGNGIQTQTNSGVWTFIFDTTGLAPGTYTLFAQATDGVNVSVPLAISLTVQ